MIRIEQVLTVKRVVSSPNGIPRIANLQGDDGTTFLQIDLGTEEERKSIKPGVEFVMYLESIEEVRS